MVMNGGVMHAVEVLSHEEFAGAVSGYRYFSLEEAATVLERAAVNIELGEDGFDRQYAETIWEDSVIVKRFEQKLAASPMAFSPL